MCVVVSLEKSMLEKSMSKKIKYFNNNPDGIFDAFDRQNIIIN